MVTEAVVALDILLRKPHYVKLIGSHWHNKLAGLKNDPRHS